MSFSALNTGRSGQPVQKLGGRTGSSPTALAAARLPASTRSTVAAIVSTATPLGRVSLKKAARPESRTSAVYSPTVGRQPLPSTGVWISARRRMTLICCSM